MERFIPLINLFSTLFMMGVIWFVQIVHYPLFQAVGEEDFAQYESLHTRRTSVVVVLPMILEIVTAGHLYFYPPQWAPQSLWLFGLVLLGIIWGSTFALQVPAHNRLEKGFHSRTHKILVWTNWIRTFAWTLRGGLWMYILANYLPLPGGS